MRRSADLSKAAGDPTYEAIAIKDVAQLLFNREQFAAAAEEFDRLMPLVPHLSRIDKEETAGTFLLKRARCARELGDTDGATRYAEDALEDTKNAERLDGQADAHNLLGAIAFHAADESPESLEKTLQHFKEAAELYGRIGKAPERIDCLDSLAFAASGYGSDPTSARVAISTYPEVIQAHVDSKDNEQLYFAHFYLGQAHERTVNEDVESMERAAESYRRAADVARILQDDRRLGYSLRRIGDCLVPDVNPQGGWKLAAAAYESAAEALSKVQTAEGAAARIDSLLSAARMTTQVAVAGGEWDAARSAYDRLVATLEAPRRRRSAPRTTSRWLPRF